MKIFRSIAIVIWRIWYYILMGLPIILLFPLLLILTSREKWYRHFFVLARLWAKIILYGMGFRPKVVQTQPMEEGKSYMLIANHTSMADIMLMLCIVKNPFVFVGKRELARIPIFGFFYKRTCILVDRNSPKSKREVFQQAERRLSQGLSICIFPEGGVSEDESLLLDKFRDGAFRLAIEHQIPIVPMVFYDNKTRFPFSFLKGGPGKMRVKMLPFISTQEKTLYDKRKLKESVRELILGELRAVYSFEK